MYLNTTIKIPEIKGKIITKKKGTTTYILYQYGSDQKSYHWHIGAVALRLAHASSFRKY